MIPGKVEYKAAPNVTVTAPGTFVWTPFTDTEEIKNLKPRLIAVAPGFGFGLPLDGDEVTLQLAADEPITGRIVDAVGRPVAAARIRVRNVFWPKPEPGFGQGRLDRWLEAIGRAAYVGDFLQASQQFLIPLEPSIKDIPAAHALFVPQVMSDVDGRFQVVGVGRERVAELIIDGPGLASGLIVAATRPIDKPLTIPAKPPAVKNQIANTWDDLPFFGHRIEYVARAGRAVEGTVTDRDHKQAADGYRRSWTLAQSARISCL